MLAEEVEQYEDKENEDENELPKNYVKENDFDPFNDSMTFRIFLFSYHLLDTNHIRLCIKHPFCGFKTPTWQDNNIYSMIELFHHE